MYDRQDFLARLSDYCDTVLCADCPFDGDHMDCGYLVMLFEAILKYIYKEDI